jgi:hypothetical protein
MGMEIIPIVSQISVALASIAALILVVMLFAFLIGQMVSGLFED